MILRFALGLGVLVGLVGAGCTDGNDPLPPERHRNALASVDEPGMRASVMDDDLALDVPIERLGEGTLAGFLEVRLTNVATGEIVLLDRAATDVTQTDATQAHRVVFRGAAADLERVDAGPMILDWRFLVDGEDDLFGKKSLFAALGNLDVQVRGPSELPATRTSPFRVIVRHPSTHAAIAGAEVEVVLETPPETEGGEPVLHALFDGTTDARGEVADGVALPETVDSGTIRVTVTHDDVQVWTTRGVARRTDDSLYLGTDKTIYQPGQDVHLRLLALTGADRLPLAEADVVFEARDGRGNKVFRRSGRTDTFGVAAIVVPTDTRVNEGDWQFHALVDGRQTQIRVPVQAYTLPKMRVSVGADRTFALPGDAIRTRVSATYMFGEPVRNATVQLDARTAAGLPLGSWTATADDQGAATFDFTVPETVRTPALEESGDTLLLNATVVDTADQRELGQAALPLAAAALRINVIGDGALVPGAESMVYVVITDAVGRPVVADVRVRGGADASLRTNASGVAELEVITSGDSLALDITATDGADRSHTRAITLAAAGTSGLRVSTDRAIYRAGDRATLRVTAPEGITRAYLDVYRGAVGVLSTEVDVSSGSAEVELPIGAELGGLLVVDAFAVGEDGATFRAARPVLVERDDRLEVTIAPERAEYLPGDEARLEVRVADSTGAPRVASVGLTVVDEAVFALGGEPTTSIRSSFGLDERVLPATVNVAGRGADALLRSSDPADREQLARLLFASAGDVRAPNFDYGSLATELPQVVSSLQSKVGRDGQEYLETLRPQVERGWISERNVRTIVRGAFLIDPFGRTYRIDVEGRDQWSMQMVLRSDGPDEERDTADDVQMNVWMGGLWYCGGFAMGGPGGRGEDFAAAGRDEADGDAPAPPADPSESGGGGMARVRRDFRETAYVNPVLITDATGRAAVTVPLAQSITTWRVSADSSSADGRVGSMRGHVRTFQPFFVDFSMPGNMTSGDEVEVPAVVYNYTTETQRVNVAIDRAPWFELIGPASQVVDLGPSEVRAARFRMRILRAGDHSLTLHGSAGTLSDALVRTVAVRPEGQPEDQSFSGRLGAGPGTSHMIEIPGDTVEGGSSVELVITPGFASEAVSGVEALLHEPNGCFEQTTSSAWPNTLVGNYLDATGALDAEKREEVIGLITRGYQRLVTFESPTGGINWWGDADPGNRILSAIMLWHLKDMETLIATDPAFRDRLLSWLLGEQLPDGSWEAGDALHAGNEVLGTSEERTTAFIAWALAHTGWAPEAVDRAAGWLRANVPPESDLYANALVANALGMADPRGAVTNEVFTRLDRMRVDMGGEEGMMWPTETPSWTGSSGDGAAIETTGLVAYGMIMAGAFPEDATGALQYIIANKDSVGTWYNTQATMNALRALSAGLTGGAGDTDGTMVITVDGVEAARLVVNAENRDFHRRFDLTRFASPTGSSNVRATFTGTGEVSYRLTRRAYRPALPPAAGPLSLTVDYDTTSPVVGSPIQVTARAVDGEEAGIRDQVIVRIGRAPGFAPRTEDLEAIVASGLASRYEVRADDVTFYLMGLAAGETRELRFRMTPGLPVDALAPASTIYAYYEPTLRQTLPPERFVVGGAD